MSSTLCATKLPLTFDTAAAIDSGGYYHTYGLDCVGFSIGFNESDSFQRVPLSTSHEFPINHKRDGRLTWEVVDSWWYGSRGPTLSNTIKNWHTSWKKMGVLREVNRLGVGVWKESDRDYSRILCTGAFYAMVVPVMARFLAGSWIQAAGRRADPPSRRRRAKNALHVGRVSLGAIWWVFKMGTRDSVAYLIGRKDNTGRDKGFTDPLTKST